MDIFSFIFPFRKNPENRPGLPICARKPGEEGVPIRRVRAVFPCMAAIAIFAGHLERPTSDAGGWRATMSAPVQAQKPGGGGVGSGSGGVSSGIATPKGTGTTATPAGGGQTTGAGSGTPPGDANQNRLGGSFPPTPSTELPAAPPTEPPTVPPAEPPTEPAPEAPPVKSETIMQWLNSPAGGESFVFSDRCVAHTPKDLGPQQRLAGANLDRLDAAQVYLAPDFDAGTQKAGIHLLANYQEELESVRPNMATAGAYLALVATRPLTGEIVGRVNAILCITATRKQVQDIARIAESQRVEAGR